VLFTYVFGSAIKIPGGGNYRDFLLPGIFVQIMMFSSAGSAIAIADDLSKGVIDRFRSLPMARSAVLTGRAVADLATECIALVVLTASGLLVGWRIHNGLASALAAYILLLGFGFAMIWVGTLIGTVMGDPEAAQQLVFTVAFPLTFVANTFVPTNGMPAWLRIVAEWNPLSAVVAGARDLFGAPGLATGQAWPLRHPVLASTMWIVGIIVVVAPLAVRRYRRNVSR
jgi:ABC transporter DrrB family efflux protein